MHESTLVSSVRECPGNPDRAHGIKPVSILDDLAFDYLHAIRVDSRTLKGKVRDDPADPIRDLGRDRV